MAKLSQGKKKSYVPVGKIKKHLRKLSFQRKEYSQAKARAKVDMALFECQSSDCSTLVYEGTSEKRFEEYQQKYAGRTLIKGKMELDHVHEVVDTKAGFTSWDDYINRLFCAPEELNPLCPECHSGVSKEEMAKRKEAGSLKRKK